jgi:ubiquinone/menaquinone biosynthesis C-methylase UbiE
MDTRKSMTYESTVREEQSMSNYIFDNAAPQAGQRFASLETLYDPWTIRHLEATGIGPGWQCWEVGAGGGSIAAWLAERCGPGGDVLVTDIDPRFLVEGAALGRPNLEIQRHDVVADPLPAQTFDLIHARLVLIHVPTREQALERMVTALKPGGWLVIEEFDITLFDRTYPTKSAEAAALFQKVNAALVQLMVARSGERALTWGRSLSRRLQAHGLVNVGMEGYLTLWEGGSPGTRFVRANFELIRQEAIAAGFVTHEEVEQMLTLLDAPDFAISSSVMFTAWGRRP